MLGKCWESGKGVYLMGASELDEKILTEGLDIRRYDMRVLNRGKRFLGKFLGKWGDSWETSGETLGG